MYNANPKYLGLGILSRIDIPVAFSAMTRARSAKSNDDVALNSLLCLSWAANVIKNMLNMIAASIKHLNAFGFIPESQSPPSIRTIGYSNSPLPPSAELITRVVVDGIISSAKISMLRLNK